MQHNYSINSFDHSDNWTILSEIEVSIKKKIEKYGTPLSEWNISINRGILTGYNNAFIIDELTKNELIATDPKSAELIRPILRGKDVKRYSYDFSNRYLICIPCGFTNEQSSLLNPEEWFKNTYYAIYKYFICTEEENSKKRSSKSKGLYERDDQGDYWWELRSCKYMDEFNKQKIMYNDINQRLSFCIAPEGVYCNNTVYFMCPKQHLFYLLAILNSKLINWYYKNISVQLGKNAVRMFTIYVNKIPIPKAEVSIEIKLTDLVQKYLEKKDAAIDAEIEKTINELYRLNSKEIDFLNSI